MQCTVEKKEAVSQVTSEKEENLQAQTKIIKIKAKNKQNKILNSNNFEAKKRGIILPRYYCSLTRFQLEENPNSFSSHSSRVAKVLIFFPPFEKSFLFAPKKSRREKWKIPSDFGVIFHVALAKREGKSYFSFVIKYFSVNNFFN